MKADMQLYYAHDPMCSWCWAFRPTLLTILENLPSNIEFISLLGGLAADSAAPMPQATREYIIENWHRIEQQVPNTVFNYDFWTQCQPRRSTYPACRAVIAARLQGAKYDRVMTHAIQQAYYLRAKNPSDTETLIVLATELNLDSQQFIHDLNSDSVNKILFEEINIAKQLGLNSFPSLLLCKNRQKTYIKHDYNSATNVIDRLKIIATQI